MSDTPTKTATVTQLPVEPLRPMPEPVVSASERGLNMVVAGLIQQHGPVSAYNILVGAAGFVRGEISAKRGRGKQGS